MSLKKLLDLTARTALVTGGSRGLRLLLASDAGRHITGQILAVDGGAPAY